MNRLIVKLLAVNLVVIAFVMAMMWLSIDTLAAGYFVTLMEKYHVSPEPAHEMFVGSVHRYLIWVCSGAAILAAVLSFLMMRRILLPLSRMTKTTHLISAGDFSSRIAPGPQDEVGQLASAFNRMAESLEKHEKLRRILMIDVAHELRTPLTNIRGYLEALDDEVVPPSAQTFELLQSETMRLAQLVEDVLQLARADAAHGNLSLEPLDLMALIHQTLEPFGGRFEEKRIRVTVDGPEEPVPVMADRHRIDRVLRNLTDNAARYTPSRGGLDICLKSMAQIVRVGYANNVEEMVPEDLPFLFERFYRGEKSRSREHGGAGIGLAIVKELVKAHDGEVGAELDNGRIEIWFSLPAK